MSAEEIIEETLKAAELEYERPRAGAYFIKLPGTHKLATMAWLLSTMYVMFPPPSA